MDDPADCYQAESLYDRDSDPPIYEKGGAKAKYRMRLSFNAWSNSEQKGEIKQFSFLWFWGAKFTDYGIMKRFQIKHIRPDKHSVFFLQDKPTELSPHEIKQRFFNAAADKSCKQAMASKNINDPPVRGVFHHTLALKKFKGADLDRKQLNTDMKIALRLMFSPTRGGGQYAEVIVKNMNKTSSCHVFSRYVKILGGEAHKDQLYFKRIEIAKRFGNSDRYYMITWLLDKTTRHR